MNRSAIISKCGNYRYSLQREWGTEGGTSNIDSHFVVCMLNPSIADALIDDPTIRRCIGFAKREGRNGLIVINAYAFRATDPKEMLKRHDHDPVGPENDAYLRCVAEITKEVVLAWGANIEPMRAARVVELFHDKGCKTLCLGVTKTGHPRHPLYLRADAPLVPWSQP